MQPEFSSLSGPAGLEIVDPIETRRFTFLTDGPVRPSAASTDEFAFPVDSACRIRAGSLTLRYSLPIDVRTPEGAHRASIDPPTDREFSDGEYLLDFHAPIKVYLRFEGAVRVEADADRVRIDFEEAVPVDVGARSYHSSPAATITVPDDPKALMRAVSAFPSALKTTSPERSWPTLRGHPPRIERGDHLLVPDGLETPDTGVTIAIPPEYGHVYTVAPLAYYLGAEVRPGETPRLSARSGVSRPLGDDLEALADETERLLKRFFLLDCVTRTEGYYPDDLYERDVLDSRTDLDFAALYDAPLAERLHAYLAVPADALADVLPPWHRVTHVESDPDLGAAELLPYVVNDLSLVRVNSPNQEPWTPTEAQKQADEAVDAFMRSATADGAGSDDFLRSADIRSPETRDGDGDLSARGVPGEGGYMPLPEVDALEQAWIGDETPVEGTKLLPEAFANESPTPTDGTIDITVVCNDGEMREEWETVSEIYGDRDDVRVNADCRFGVETDDLRNLLGDRSDLFHFVGHIDGQGFKCPDGILDANTVEATGATTVLLNGCRSHDQGIELVKAGANAAVVSLGDLWNEGAVEVGETLARLFHHGFSVGHAMKIVREYTSLGNHYVVVGDPGVTLVQCKNGVPCMFHIHQKPEAGGPDEVAVEPHLYPIRGYSIGSIARPYLSESDHYFLAVGGCLGTTANQATVYQALEGGSDPLIVDEELVWSDQWFENS